MRRSNWLALLVVYSLLAACAPQAVSSDTPVQGYPPLQPVGATPPAGYPGPTPAPTLNPTQVKAAELTSVTGSTATTAALLQSASGVPTRAVYLVEGQAVLTAADLQAHPEILVVHTFDELASHVGSPVAIWLDKSATPFGGLDWLNAAPQAWYPMAVVGYNNAFYSFARMMDVCCFSGPAVTDWGRLEPGFSIMQRRDNGTTLPEAIYIHGFDQVPTAADILAITNALLDGRLRPTATPVITAATPSPPPLRLPPTQVIATATAPP